MSRKNFIKGIKCIITGHNYKPVGVHYVKQNPVAKTLKGNVKYCETCGSLLRTTQQEGL